MTKLSDKVRALMAEMREDEDLVEWCGQDISSILADVESLETELEEAKQVAIASRWCSEFYSQAPGPGQIAQMFGGLLMGLTEYRRTDVRNAKIEAYEDAHSIVTVTGASRLAEHIELQIQARIDALKAGAK